jgi:hypothetical protein
VCHDIWRSFCLCYRPLKGGIALVKQEIMEECRQYNRDVVTWNLKLRQLQAGSGIDKEIAALMSFRKAVGVQIMCSDFP